MINFPCLERYIEIKYYVVTNLFMLVFLQLKGEIFLFFFFACFLLRKRHDRFLFLNFTLNLIARFNKNSKTKKKKLIKFILSIYLEINIKRLVKIILQLFYIIFLIIIIIVKSFWLITTFQEGDSSHFFFFTFNLILISSLFKFICSP